MALPTVGPRKPQFPNIEVSVGQTGSRLNLSEYDEVQVGFTTFHDASRRPINNSSWKRCPNKSQNYPSHQYCTHTHTPCRLGSHFPTNSRDDTRYTQSYTFITLKYDTGMALLARSGAGQQGSCDISITNYTHLGYALKICWGMNFAKPVLQGFFLGCLRGV